MAQGAATYSTVIARLDRAIQYAALADFDLDVSVYWMSRLRGA
jgi:hypothetical protein